MTTKKTTATIPTTEIGNMSHLRHYSFNLVEIVLAMAVLAIGISSVLVLFPVGVNANRDAVAGNNMADLSEQIISQVRAAVEGDWKGDGNNNFLKKLKSSYPKSELMEGDKEFEITSDNASIGMIEANGESGVFLFRILSPLETGTYITDFSAVVQVWMDESFSDFYVATPNASEPQELEENDRNSLKNFAAVILIEVSWPANLKYVDREKAYFRLESFDNRFKPIKAQ